MFTIKGGQCSPQKNLAGCSCLLELFVLLHLEKVNWFTILSTFFAVKDDTLVVCAAGIGPMIGAMFKGSRFGQKPLAVHTIQSYMVLGGGAFFASKEFVLKPPKQRSIENGGRRPCGKHVAGFAYTERQHVSFHALRSQNAPLVTQAMGCEWIGRWYVPHSHCLTTVGIKAANV